MTIEQPMPIRLAEAEVLLGEILLHVADPSRGPWNLLESPAFELFMRLHGPKRVVMGMFMCQELYECVSRSPYQHKLLLAKNQELFLLLCKESHRLKDLPFECRLYGT